MSPRTRSSVSARLSQLSELAGLGADWPDMTLGQWSRAVCAGLPRSYPTTKQEEKTT